MVHRVRVFNLILFLVLLIVLMPLLTFFLWALALFLSLETGVSFTISIFLSLLTVSILGFRYSKKKIVTNDNNILIQAFFGSRQVEYKNISKWDVSTYGLDESPAIFTGEVIRIWEKEAGKANCIKIRISDLSNIEELKEFLEKNIPQKSAAGESLDYLHSYY